MLHLTGQGSDVGCSSSLSASLNKSDRCLNARYIKGFSIWLEEQGSGGNTQMCSRGFPPFLQLSGQELENPGSKEEAGLETDKESSRQTGVEVERLNPQQGSMRARIRALTGPALFVIHAIQLIPKVPWPALCNKPGHAASFIHPLWPQCVL